MIKSEKRRTPRQLIAVNASLSRDLKTELGTTKVQTLNLNKHGALIQAPAPLSLGEVCTFSLTLDSGKPTEIQGRVVWSSQVAEGMHHAGVAFRNLSPDEEYLLELKLIRNRRT